MSDSLQTLGCFGWKSWIVSLQVAVLEVYSGRPIFHYKVMATEQKLLNVYGEAAARLDHRNSHQIENSLMVLEEVPEDEEQDLDFQDR